MRTAATEEACTHKFSRTERWFPVLYKFNLYANVPYAFTIRERNLVMFRDEVGKNVVMNDMCTRRAAPISKGRLTSKVEKTVLERPYHGWAFDGTGSCVRTTQLKEWQGIPAAVNMNNVYSTHVHYRTAYVWMGEPGRGDASQVSHTGRGMDLSQFEQVPHYGEYSGKLSYDVATLSENLVDP